MGLCHPGLIDQELDITLHQAERSSLEIMTEAGTSVDTLMGTMGSTSYQYPALADATNSIRVLTVQPTATYGPTEAICTLEEVCLDTSSSYTALSYTWAMDSTGDASKSRFLTISSRHLPITQNLHECISRIRVRKHPLRIWIDAVCINQDDVAERTAQVSAMARIYQNAVQTITWLGESDDRAGTEELRCLLLRMSRCEDNFVDYMCAFLALDDRVSTAFWSRLGYVKYAGGRCKLNGDQDGHGSKDWSASLIKILQKDTRFTSLLDHRIRLTLDVVSRRYWSRRWVVQEMYHSKDIRIYWGRAVLDQQQFFLACKYMERIVGFLRSIYLLNPIAKEPLASLQDVLESDNLSYLINLKLHLRDAFATGGFRNFCGREDQLPWLLDRCGDMHCRDPRDRLFALLSMFPKPIMEPNYELTTSGVFVDLAKRIPKMRKRSGWIVEHWRTRSYANSSQSDAIERELPSWVLDFRRPLPEPSSLELPPSVLNFTVNSDNSASFSARILGRLKSFRGDTALQLVPGASQEPVAEYVGPGEAGDIVCGIGLTSKPEYLWLFVLRRVDREEEATFKITGLTKLIGSLNLEAGISNELRGVREQHLLATVEGIPFQPFRVV